MRKMSLIIILTLSIFMTGCYTRGKSIYSKFITSDEKTNINENIVIELETICVDGGEYTFDISSPLTREMLVDAVNETPDLDTENMEISYMIKNFGALIRFYNIGDREMYVVLTQEDGIMYLSYMADCEIGDKTVIQYICSEYGFEEESFETVYADWDIS